MNSKLKKPLKWLPLAVVVIVAVVVLCVVFAPAKAPTLSLSAKPIVVEVGNSKIVEFTCSNDKADIEFEIDNDSIAYVDDNKIIGLKIGSTTLKIKAELGNESSFINVNVIVIENSELPVVDLPNDITLYLLDKDIDSANAAGYYKKISFNALTNYSFTSSSSNVVKHVASTRTLVANKVGESILTFTSTTSGKSTMVRVRVLEVKPTIEGLPAEILLEPNEIYNLSFNISPSYYTGNAKVEMFSTSDIIEISDNIITAKIGGICEIGVKLNDKIVAKIPVYVALPVKVNINTVSGCDFKNNVLKVESGVEANFTVTFEDEKGDEVSTLIPYLESKMDLEEELGYYHLLTNSEGEIKVYVKGYPNLIAIIYVCLS